MLGIVIIEFYNKSDELRENDFPFHKYPMTFEEYISTMD